MAEAIEKLYQDILERQSDPEGLAYWASQLENGMSLDDIAAAISASEENVKQDIAQAYQSELGRQYDQAGYDYWVNEALNNPEYDLNAVVDMINKSEEGRLMDPTEVVREGLFSGYQDYNLDEQRARDYVTAMYWSELGRAPDAEGLDFWTNEVLNNPQQSMGSVLQGISRSEEGMTYDPSNLVFGGLDGITNEEILAGMQPFTDVYTDPTLFANRTAGYNAGYAMGDSPWQVTVRDEQGNPSTYYLDPAADRATGAYAGYGTPNSRLDYRSNYGKFGKYSNESLADYYKRLSTEREGGILGQGLLSATPTVGSAAWDKLNSPEMQALAPEVISQVGTGSVNSQGQYDYGQMGAGMENFMLGLATSNPIGLTGLLGKIIGQDAIDQRMEAIQRQIDETYANSQQGIQTVVDSSGNVSSTYSPYVWNSTSDAPSWDATGNVWDGWGDLATDTSGATSSPAGQYTFDFNSNTSYPSDAAFEQSVLENGLK